MLADDEVVEQPGTGDEALPAMQRRAQAHQADEVGGVGVEPEILVRRVRPLVRTAPAEVPDMANQVASAVLRHQVPHVPANSPEHNGGVVLAEPVVDGQPAQQHEPKAMFQLVHDDVDPFPEMRKREILCLDLGDIVDVLPGGMRERSLEIGEIFFGEANKPAASVGELVAPPYTHRRYRLSENLGHRRRSLAAHAAPQLIVGPVILLPLNVPFDRNMQRASAQLFPQVLACSGIESVHPGLGAGISVMPGGQGFRISGGSGVWLKLKSLTRFPSLCAFSRTSGRESGRPSVTGLSRAWWRKSSSMNLR